RRSRAVGPASARVRGVRRRGPPAARHRQCHARRRAVRQGIHLRAGGARGRPRHHPLRRLACVPAEPMNRFTPPSSSPALKETTMTQAQSRRRVLKLAATAVALSAAHGSLLAQSKPKIRIGYWPVASGIPFFAAVEKGYFKEAGLDV